MSRWHDAGCALLLFGAGVLLLAAVMYLVMRVVERLLY